MAGDQPEKKADKKAAKAAEKAAKKSEAKEKMFQEVSEKLSSKSYEERIKHLTSEVEELRSKNELLESQYTSQRETQADILKTLHQNLEGNYDKIEDHEQNIEHLENTIADTKQAHREELDSTSAAFSKQIEGLTYEKDELHAQLESLRDFQVKQKSIETDFSELSRKLETSQEEHERHISALERKKAIEIDQLKKDMLQKIRETRDALRAKTKDQLDATTKRTIMENEQMTTEYFYRVHF